VKRDQKTRGKEILGIVNLVKKWKRFFRGEEKRGTWERMAWCYAAVFLLVIWFQTRKRPCRRAR
jgi:hypothetical protein